VKIAPKPNINWTFLIFLLLLVIVFAIVAQALTQTRAYLVNDDFFTFYLSGYMISRGEDPYQAEQWVNNHYLFGATWIPEQIYLYPLPLAILLSPIGLLSLSQASVAWVFFAQVLVLVTVLMVMSFWRVPRSTPYILPVLAGIFLFRPTMVAIRNGQIGPYLLIIIVLVALFWHREQWLAGGIALAFLSLKPGIGLPIIGILFLWLLARRQVQGIVGLSLALFAIMFSGWLIAPDWIQNFLWMGEQKLSYSFGYSPTIWGMAGSVCKNNDACTVYVGAGACLLLVLFYLYWLLWKSRWVDPVIAIGSALAVALLITPYMWAYDQILLIFPLVLIVGQLAERKLPYLVTSTFLIIVSIVAILLILMAMWVGHDSWSATISVLVLGLMIVLYRERRLE
jgi:hypothetical protein